MLAGGKAFFNTGRYIRYPQTMGSPLANMPRTGPALSRLYVSVMQAMGQSDTSFGIKSGTTHDGRPLSLEGPLSQLNRA